MSYLNSPNLVFTGDFLADTSTVNNDVRHYDNASFESYFQEPTDPDNSRIMNGWWNPSGGSVFNFQNCTVQQISFPDGSTQNIEGGEDPVLGQLVGGPEGRATGKMVDMDPQWQMSSELWCVRLRIYTAKNDLLLSGDIAVSGFRDLQMRQMQGGSVNGQPMGGGWTSVLTNVVWGDAADTSPFLKKLKEITQNNTLSIQLNMYGFYYAHADGRFAMGRIIGTIGPWFEKEPKTFAPHRRLYGVLDWSDGNIYLNYSNFLVDTKNKYLTLDLGGSFPIQDSMGTITGNTQFMLGVLKGSSDFVPSKNETASYLLPEDFIEIGAINYTSGNNNWLNTTGGIVKFKNLSAAQLDQLSNHQLVVVTPSTKKPGQFVLVCREAVDGINVRADNLNARLDADESVDICLYAYQWGLPLDNNTINVTIQPPTPAFFGGQMVGPHTPKAKIPIINVPPDGLDFPDSIKTTATGLGTLTIHGNRIGTPRNYIDGQMYYLTYLLNGNQPDPACYSMDSIYINLRTFSPVLKNPTWDDVSEILTQFGNVYPLMSKYIVDLGSETAVLSKKDILIYSFTRDIHDPLYMPATRDISEAMRQTIVNWLNNPISGGTHATRSMKSENEMASTEDISINESDEIKEVVKLTQAKNGATPITADLPSPFDKI